MPVARRYVWRLPGDPPGHRGVSQKPPYSVSACPGISTACYLVSEVFFSGPAIIYEKIAQKYHPRENPLSGTRKTAHEVLTDYGNYNTAMKNLLNAKNRGTTLPEALVTIVILATFFAAIFELNAVCLRYIDATKESVAALQSVQDRAEMLRNLAFTDLVTPASVQSLMATPPNAAPFAQKATEVVKLSAFPTPNGVSQFTRSPAGVVTTDSVATDLGKELVQVQVQVAWSMTLGGKTRTEQTTNILSNGSKK